MVTSSPYVPARRTTVPPLGAASTARARVRSGAASVPDAVLLPDGDTWTASAGTGYSVVPTVAAPARSAPRPGSGGGADGPSSPVTTRETPSRAVAGTGASVAGKGDEHGGRAQEDGQQHPARDAPGATEVRASRG